MDYYETLGISKEASEIDIKKAYRRLAHIHHPDKSTGDAGKFKQITEAYDVLSNASKRSSYDRFGTTDVEGLDALERVDESFAQAPNRKKQQVAMVESLVGAVIAECIADRSKTPKATKELAQRIVNLIYGD